MQRVTEILRFHCAQTSTRLDTPPGKGEFMKISGRNGGNKGDSENDRSNVSLRGCQRGNCLGQGLAVVGSGESPGPGFLFGGKGRKPQLSRARLSYGFRNPGGYTAVKKPMKKKKNNFLGLLQLMNRLPEGKGGRERRFKSQTDTTDCSSQADIREMSFIWDAVLLQQGWPRAVLPARACLI